MKRIIIILLIVCGATMVFSAGSGPVANLDYRRESLPKRGAKPIYIALDFDSKNVVVRDSVVAPNNPKLDIMKRAINRRTEYLLYNDKGELLWRFYSYGYDEQLLDAVPDDLKAFMTRPRTFSPKKAKVKPKHIQFDITDKLGAWSKEDMHRFMREEVKLELREWNNFPMFVDFERDMMVGYDYYLPKWQQRLIEREVEEQSEQMEIMVS